MRAYKLKKSVFCVIVDSKVYEKTRDKGVPIFIPDNEPEFIRRELDIRYKNGFLDIVDIPDKQDNNGDSKDDKKVEKPNSKNDEQVKKPGSKGNLKEGKKRGGKKKDDFSFIVNPEKK